MWVWFVEHKRCNRSLHVFIPILSTFLILSFITMHFFISLRALYTVTLLSTNLFFVVAQPMPFDCECRKKKWKKRHEHNVRKLFCFLKNNVQQQIKNVNTFIKKDGRYDATPQRAYVCILCVCVWVCLNARMSCCLWRKKKSIAILCRCGRIKDNFDGETWTTKNFTTHTKDKGISDFCFEIHPQIVRKEIIRHKNYSLIWVKVSFGQIFKEKSYSFKKSNSLLCVCSKLKEHSLLPFPKYSFIHSTFCNVLYLL